ncbi:MAG: NHL repeat protein [Lentisphaerae bacterium ADurb.BinA184]|nr:MAG: NHL repeat protein [Lentisphaerae bacterium ADurb.BinA184]
MDGKLSVVIEDADGNRVRNLLSGQPFAAGQHAVVWDGCDDGGQVMPPGRYAWRAISHPGITPNYLFSFCNDGDPPWRTGTGRDMWGPDHSTLSEAVAGKEWTFLAGTVAESGYAIVAVDAAGVKRMHYNAVHGTGLAMVCLATDDTYLYAAHDGPAWGQRINRQAADWKTSFKLTVTRYDIASGRVVDFPEQGRFAVALEHQAGPGSETPQAPETVLAGLTSHDGKLVVALRHPEALMILDAATGKPLKSLPLPSPGPVRADGAGLVAVSGDRIVRLDPATGAVREIVPAGVLSPAGLAAGPDGAVYVSDRGTHTVRVFGADGRETRPIGRPGGPYTGPWQPERMVNPRGLAISANGWLWVTEARLTPKRACAWELATGRLVKEKYGPTNYGASGAGFDTTDPTRWIGQGTLWKLDFDGRSATPASILGGLFTPSHCGFVRRDGRVFLIGLDGFTTVAELLPDGTRRELAAIGSTHRFCFAMDWNPPAVFVEAFERAYPERKGKHADKGPGFLWVDVNGDGALQAEEFTFSTAAENFAGAYWGHDFADLTIRVPARVGGSVRLVTLAPDGYHPGGAPRYPDLNEACRQAVPIALGGNEIETATDRFGNLICNSDPRMTSFAPDGRVRWQFPNRWTNVHGSHQAPLPETGVMQGALYFLGMAPFDDTADVFVMNGNHGRFFVLTSDGIYLDEMFKDVRMGVAIDAYLIGGECFGGFFARSETDGAYYLQSGHTDYRIFRINGLDRAVRSAGTLDVSAAQVAAAENSLRRAVAEVAEPRRVAVPRVAAAPAVDGDPAEWPEPTPARWDRDGKFPVQAAAAFDDGHLYLCWRVEDNSPFVNQGRDWTLLHKTGDCVDFQFGADSGAPAGRLTPVPGDCRLLIAPTDGQNATPAAILYRYRVPGTAKPMSFVSPWRSTTVDEVVIVREARIAVKRQSGGYCVEAALPLAALGLEAAAGKALAGDFGVIYGDPSGNVNMLRSYWANRATGLVNDVPGETMLMPNLWGRLEFAE